MRSNNKPSLWTKLFGEHFADAPLFFKLWFGICFGGALLIFIAFVIAFIAALTDDRSLTHRAGEAAAELQQGYKDGLNAP